ncbi:MAG: excinuclease ABC subunit UvrC [Desulfuromonas sp.]
MTGLNALDLSRISTGPGVYLMCDSQQQVLYVGKARNLRARLRQYLRGDDSRPQIRYLLRRVAQVETLVTDTEKEALILENTLIKKHRPRYNINLRDDKTYVSLRIDTREPFPAIEIVRRVRRDGAQYFGPYASAGALRQTLRELYRLFPLRRHPWSQCRKRERPCLFYQIGQCSGPCHGHIDSASYQRMVQAIIAFLSGRGEPVLQLLRQRMATAAQQLHYEEAAALRDQLRAMEQTLEQQKMVSGDGADLDVIGLRPSEGELSLCLLFVRGGRLIGRRGFSLPWLQDQDELLAAFVQQYYGGDTLIPPTLLLPLWPAGHEALQLWLQERRGQRVELRVPQRGQRLELVELAAGNAAELARQRADQSQARQSVLEQIQQALGLKRLPRRIECYDISNTQGQHSVASKVAVYDGEPDRAAYRHYRIKTVSGSDDFASLAEVLQRRLQRGLREDDLPDLLLIDGGKGQLAAVAAILEGLQLTGQVELVSIAKSRVRHNARGRVLERSEERFFRPGRKNPLVLRQGSAALFLLERLRDEAHRFAISHHRRLRQQATLTTILDQIDGVGPARRKRLLRQFGSVAAIRRASLDQLQAAEGLPPAVAAAVWHFFHQEKESPDHAAQLDDSAGAAGPR